MSDPRIEEDRETPLRLQPVVSVGERGGSRSTALIAVGLVGFVLAGIVLGVTNIGGPERLPPLVLAPDDIESAEPSPRPTRRGEPTTPPWPDHLVLGDQVPSERRLVYGEGLQVLDVATGELSEGPWGWDGVLPISEDQLACVCVRRGAPDAATGDLDVALVFRRFSLDGRLLIERDIGLLEGVRSVPEMDEGFNVSTVVSPDRTRIVAIVVALQSAFWNVSVLDVDARTGGLTGQRTVAIIPLALDEPQPSASPAAIPGNPPDGRYVWANQTGVSRDGRTAYVGVTYSEVLRGNWTNGSQDWMVPLGPDGPGDARAFADELALPRDGWCASRPTFTASGVLVQICWPRPDDPSMTGFWLRRANPDGSSAGSVSIAEVPETDYWSSPIFDANGDHAFLWYPRLHRIARVDLVSGSVDVADIGPAVEPNSARGYLGGEPFAVLSPDGSRLYALGAADMDRPDGASSGVWVIDATTLELIDHWDPVAYFVSLAVSADGRFVYAIGSPDHDAEGRSSAWPTSLTVFEAETGEIQVIHGRLERNTWLNFATF